MYRSDWKSLVVADMARYGDAAAAVGQHTRDGLALLDKEILDLLNKALEDAGLAGELTLFFTGTGDGGQVLLNTPEEADRFAESLHKLSRGDPVRHFRVGIATGIITLKKQVATAGEYRADHISGLAVIQAVRQEGACCTGEVLICENTYWNLPEARCRLYEQVPAVKGKRGEQFRGCYRRVVVNPAPWDRRPDPLELPPLVIHTLPPARHFQPRPESEAVGEFWRGERGGVLGVIAIGGAGKTRLVEHFLRELATPRDSQPPALPEPNALGVWSFYQRPNPGEFLEQLTAHLGCASSEWDLGKQQARIKEALGRARPRADPAGPRRARNCSRRSTPSRDSLPTRPTGCATCSTGRGRRHGNLDHRHQPLPPDRPSRPSRGRVHGAEDHQTRPTRWPPSCAPAA